MNTLHFRISRIGKWLVILAALIAGPALAQSPETISDTGDGEFVVPDNVYELTVEVWGAGGRGGNRSNQGGAGGGGGGAYSRSVLSVTPGETLDYRVGAGSVGSGQGGDTWFANSSILLARGGESGSNNAAGGQGANGGSGVGDVRHSGGDGADGRSGGNGYGGGGGSSAGANQNGNPGNNASGGTAPAGGGGGGDGGEFVIGVLFGQNGAPGTQPGGGGGGATLGVFGGGGDGGPGADGQIVITYEELEAPPAEIEAEWRMDEAEWSGTSGEITDSSGNSHDATARTGGNDGSLPETVAGQVCNAGRFRGQGFQPDDPPPWWVEAEHYAEAADAPGLSPLTDVGGMSIGGWVQMQASNGTVLHKGEGNQTQEYRVFVNGGQLRLTLWNRFGGDSTMTISPQSLSPNTWYFFTVTAHRLPNSNDIRVRGYLYDEGGQIGGVTEQTLTVDYTNKDTSGRFYFGATSYGSAPVEFLDGLLDEIRVYSGILDENEIEDFWSTDRPCPQTIEPVLEYRFEENTFDGTPGDVADSSGNDRDGTSSGGLVSSVDAPAIPGNPGTCRYAGFEASGNSRNGDYIQSPDLSETLNDTATMTFWIRTTQTSDNTEAWQSPGIAGVEDDGGTDDIFWGWIDESGRIGMSVGNDFDADQTSTTLISDGEWHHIALTWDRTTGDTEIYVDGDLDREGNTGTGQIIGNSYSSIGRIENTNSGIDPYYIDGELDEVRVYEGVLSAGEIAAISQATRPCEIGYDHIRLIHPETGLTCSPSTITVQACNDADCTNLYPDPVEIDFTSPAATWSDDPVTFSGSTTVSLQYTNPGVVTLGASPIDPAVSNPTRCFSSGVETNCEMGFFDSGFSIEVPNHVAGSSVTGNIAAVRADSSNPEQCVPGFDNETKDIGFWSEYVNPTSGSLSAEIDGSAITTASPGTLLPIAFDENGVGEFLLQYPDVGDVEINARYEGTGDESGLLMFGEDRFVARPARFSLEVPGNPAAMDENGDVFTAAGNNFDVTVAARNANDGITPNFGNEVPAEDVDLEVSLVAPSGGASPGLAGDFNAFGTDCDGNSATAGTSCGAYSWPEVGIISLTPRLVSGAYLGTSDVVGTTMDQVGRFIPAHFELGSSNIVNRAALGTCGGSSFTYIGERFDVEFTLYARNTAGSTTANYEGAFAFLGGDDLDLSGTPSPAIDAASVSWVMGVGDAGAQLSLPRSAPEGPYPSYTVTTSPIDGDGVALGSSGIIGSTELRFGRIVIDNAIGSELGPLELPWRAEYWDGDTWLVNDSDDCTAMNLNSDVLLSSSGGDENVQGDASVSLDGGTTAIDEAESMLTLSGGTGRFHFTAPSPSTSGWVKLVLGLDSNWPFLRDELDDDDSTPYEENPQARATFGLFDGNSQRIYIREIPPQ